MRASTYQILCHHASHASETDDRVEPLHGNAATQETQASFLDIQENTEGAMGWCKSSLPSEWSLVRSSRARSFLHGAFKLIRALLQTFVLSAAIFMILSLLSRQI
jgi:hypothetical protein